MYKPIMLIITAALSLVVAADELVVKRALIFDSFRINSHTNQDGFGASQSIESGWAVIGAPGNPNFNKHGQVYVYKKSFDQWLLHHTLQASSPHPNDQFGAQVSFSNRHLLVSSRSSTLQAEIHLFELVDNNWNLSQTFNDIIATDLLAISGDRLVLGATGKVFEKIAQTWQLTHEFYPNNPIIRAIDISGDQLIIGLSGLAEVHHFNNNQWQLQTTLIPEDIERLNDTEFGSAVAIDQDLAVIGAFHDNDNGHWFSGAAYVYKNHNQQWDMLTKLLSSDGAAGDFFGVSVSISADHVVVGSASPRGTGSYHFRSTDEGTWPETHLLNDSFFIANSMDHAIACNSEEGGGCVIFNTPLFKSDFQ